MTLKQESACGEAQPQVSGNPQVVDSVQPPSTYRTTHPSSSATGHPTAIPSSTPLYTMSLLTPSESRAFRSFLDTAAFPLDWNMQLEISHDHMPPAHGTEALTRATKDLMSLDGDKWRFPLAPYSPGSSSVTPPHSQQQAQINPLSLLYSTRRQRSLASNADAAELANPSSAHLGPSDSHTHFPSHRVTNPVDQRRSSADFYSYDRSSSSSSSRHSPVDHLTSSSSSTRLPSSAKRSPPSDAQLSSKRHRVSISRNPANEVQLLPQNRVTLLSPSQKKANHIQSEQKRRANIRRGYDALCETVPALREACLEEEDQQLADSKSRSRRRGKAKAKSDDGEKIDGRAGPRSENVVLSKTIDYLQELLSEREALMQRLHTARSALPADHPLLHPPPDAPLPLWEQKWTGGESKGNDDDDYDDDD